MRKNKKYEAALSFGGSHSLYIIERNCLAYRVTYKTIQLLNERRIHYLIVTKSDMVASDKYLEIFFL